MIAIIAILAAMLLPALNKARESAKTTKCAGNLKELGTIINIWIDDHNGTLPAAEFDYIACDKNGYSGAIASGWTWANSFMEQKYINSLELLRCPSNTATVSYVKPSYGMNTYLGYYAGPDTASKSWQKQSLINKPTETFFLVDAREPLVIPTWGDAYLPYYQRHNLRANVSWADGHVSSKFKNELEGTFNAYSNYYWRLKK